MYNNSFEGNSAITLTPIKSEPSTPTKDNSPMQNHLKCVDTTETATTTNAFNATTPQNLPGNSYRRLPHTNSNSSANQSQEKTPKNPKTGAIRKVPPNLDTFWPNILADVRSIQQVDAKHQALPLARIKKIMKLDEDAKMIAAEAPLLFAKACEYFIQELTMRAWIHTEESRRRTLQRSDIAQAIANYDQFDFLIDIVPREEIKPSTGPASKKDASNANSSSSNTDAANNAASNQPTASTTTVNQIDNNNAAVAPAAETIVNPFVNATPANLPQAAAAATTTATPQTVTHAPQVQILQQAVPHPQQLQYFITIPGGQQLQHHAQQPQAQAQHQLAGFNLLAHPQQQQQQLILTTGPNGQLTATPAPAQATIQQQAQVQQQPNIQLMQQIMTPSGELTNVPVRIYNHFSSNLNNILLSYIFAHCLCQKIVSIHNSFRLYLTKTTYYIQIAIFSTFGTVYYIKYIFLYN